MARLHEYQGKPILSKAGIPAPRGEVARSGSEAVRVAGVLGGPVVVKAQAWTTSRAAQGGIAFADTPAQAGAHAERMLATTFGQFPVTEVLVEEKLRFNRELFLSIAIDERARAPVMILSGAGGSGVEERVSSAARIACDVVGGPDGAALDAAVRGLNLTEKTASLLKAIARKAFDTARAIDARSLEINPLVETPEGELIAADCRITVDDYAVSRHPELGIEIARELDHPPTALERQAYRVEQEDHRGTFFFAQMAREAASGSRGLVGFHGAGGGGSMMAMDAVTSQGLTVANFCDTSGNPSPAKVYRAARIILSQPGLVGYFGSGSGVASQEQFWSAYGLAKAFWELDLDIPAVIRLGGNTEDRAVEILRTACAGLKARVEGYRKNDPPAAIAARFSQLVSEGQCALWAPRAPRRPAFATGSRGVAFTLRQGTAWVSRDVWRSDAAAIMGRAPGLFRDADGGPVAAIHGDEPRQCGTSR